MSLAPAFIGNIGTPPNATTFKSPTSRLRYDFQILSPWLSSLPAHVHSLLKFVSPVAYPDRESAIPVDIQMRGSTHCKSILPDERDSLLLCVRLPSAVKKSIRRKLLATSMNRLSSVTRLFISHTGSSVPAHDKGFRT